MKGTAPVTVLSSAVGLGVYIPALLVQQQLTEQGIPSEVDVIERHFATPKQLLHIASRAMQHENFALAQIAHRMTKDTTDALDLASIDALLHRWTSEGRTRFITWSGFWLPLIERYRELIDAPLSVDHCRIDAVVSASFRIHPSLRAGSSEIWLWNWDQRRLVHSIPVAGLAPVAYANRDNRVLVHGGGWGLGDYRQRLAMLRRSTYALDSIIHAPAESSSKRSHDRCFMIRTDWNAWQRNASGGHDFPPMLEVSTDGTASPMPGSDGHAMHSIIRTAKAIVSKPGGCTLIDSLAAATPLVFLQAYGDAEPFNARIWRELGFGMHFDEWQEGGFSEAPLRRMHESLLSARQGGIDYVRSYVQRMQSVHRE